MQEHGGQLALYNSAYQGPLLGAGYLSGEPAVVVAPLGGRLLMFDSHLDHEVLPAHHQRLSITAWFYDNNSSSSGGGGEGGGGRQGGGGGVAAGAGGGGALGAESQQAAIAVEEAAAVEVAGTTVGRQPEGRGEPEVLPGQESATGTEPQAAVKVPSASSTIPPPAAVARSASVIPSVLHASRPRIFVMIASFRDPETQWTLRDVFKQAAAPERVTVGVVWQVDKEQDAGLTRVAGTKALGDVSKQVRDHKVG